MAINHNVNVDFKNSKGNKMNLVARKWSGAAWPEERVSIADSDSDMGLFINARYAGIDESLDKAKVICHRNNCHDDLKSSLMEMIDLVSRLAVVCKFDLELRPEYQKAKEAFIKAGSIQ